MDPTGLVYVELGLIFVGISLLGAAARKIGLSPICLLYTSPSPRD